MSREAVKAAKRIVVKVGSSLLTNPDLSLNRDFISSIGKQLVEIRNRCDSIVLVTSGAVAAGLQTLGWQKRPDSFTDLHVAASVGQLSLFRAYDEILTPLGMRSAQVLLTAEELSHRKTYLNARTTLSRLLELDFLPIVNENDAIALHERRFGDNDTLAAELVHLTEAQVLILLTNVDGIFTNFETKQTLPEASVDDAKLDSWVASGKSSMLGVGGGMGSKIVAATRAGFGGTPTIIADGNIPDVLPALLAGKNIGSLLTGTKSRNLSAKERWLATSAKINGTLVIDEGAVEAVTKNGRSLLPIGILEGGGAFREGDAVLCQSKTGENIAIGITNYASHVVSTLLSNPKIKIGELVGDDSLQDEIIHQDNMLILGGLTDAVRGRIYPATPSMQKRFTRRAKAKRS